MIRQFNSRRLDLSLAGTADGLPEILEAAASYYRYPSVRIRLLHGGAVGEDGRASAHLLLTTLRGIREKIGMKVEAEVVGGLEGDLAFLSLLASPAAIFPGASLRFPAPPAPIGAVLSPGRHSPDEPVGSWGWLIRAAGKDPAFYLRRGGVHTDDLIRSRDFILAGAGLPAIAPVTQS
jgi:hypothetical protein